MSVVIDGSNGVTTNSGAVYNGLQTGTAQASTSGTSITFTGIPSWVKRITLMCAGIANSGGSNYLLQIGSGSITTSGYISGAWTNPNINASSTAGMLLIATGTASATSGNIVLNNVTSNSWVSSGVLSGTTANGYNNLNGGSVSLSGVLDRVRITMVNGTDTFTAGSINIIYE